ncbi:MAG: ABC transporter ATP-binding protein [Enterovibrio sp.]
MLFRFFERLTNAFPPEEPVTPPQNLRDFFFHYSRGFIKPLLLMSALTVIIAIAEVSLFGFMGELVDWLAKQDPKTFWQQEQRTLIFFAALALCIPVLIGLHSLILHQSLLGNFPMAIRWLAHRYLLKQSVSFYQDDFAGRIATKVMQTALAIRDSAIKILNVAVYILVYFATMMVIVAQADLRLLLPMLFWLVCYVALQTYFVPKLKKLATEQADARSSMTGRIVDSYSNITTVKLFSHTDRETKHVKESMTCFLHTVHRQMRLASGFNISVEINNYFLLFSITALSLFLWIDSAITVGSIAIAISLALRVNNLSKWIMWEIGALFEQIGTASDGMQTIAAPISVTDQADAKQLLVTAGEIEFRNLSFGYDENSKVIDNLSLTIKPGEKVGLVGRSGAGKSTLVNLLLRFYNVDENQIFIDGQDINNVTQDSLRKNIGVVTQDTSLLHRTIGENILYGRPDASDEELHEASRKAQAHDFIMELKDQNGNCGYATQVGDRGVKLSGGQRQRISIARALLKNAPLLILDEATSALDSEVESAIQENLYQLMTGKTVIAIAHRLSTIAEMDRLVVLDKGKIIEQGSHHELLELNGVYAQLWQRQTGGFIGE